MVRQMKGTNTSDARHGRCGQPGQLKSLDHQHAAVVQKDQAVMIPVGFAADVQFVLPAASSPPIATFPAGSPSLVRRDENGPG